MSTRPASDLERIITEFRRQILDLDERAIRAMIELYKPIRVQLLAEVESLSAELAAAGSLSAADALRLERAQTLLTQAEAELLRLAPHADALIGAYRQRALAFGSQHAQGLAIATAGMDGAAAVARISAQWNRLNTGAIEQIAGRLSDRAPLRGLLDALGQDTSDRIAAALREQIALGNGPREVAARLAREVDVPAARLLTIARTEGISAYRDANMVSYQANSDLLDGWIWASTQSENSCLACLSLDGTLFPISETFFPSHPNCRCSPRPSIKGIDSAAPTTGTDWFYGLPEERRLAMVPPSIRADVQSGRVTLSDFVKLDRNPTWGDRYVQAGAGEVRASANSRRVAA